MSSEVRLMSNADWHTLYPAEEYKAKASQLLFHFLIARVQPDETIIQQLKPKKHLLVAVDSERDGLTPLIIATMKGNVVIVRAMLDSWKDNRDRQTLVDMRDAHEWSALEHARLSSKEIFDLLTAFGASLQTAIPDTDLRLLRTKQIESYTLKKVTVATEDGHLIPLAEFGIGKIGLESYRDIPYYPDPTLAILWRRTKKNPRNFGDKLFQKFQSNPPTLTIGTCPGLKGASYPFELRAGEPIPEATCVGVYTGCVVDNKKKIYPSIIGSFREKIKVETYLLDQVDATSVGNVTRMANWGWPNVIMDQVTDNGQTLPILISLEPLMTGDPLHFNYMTMACLALDVPAPILGVEKMRSFYTRGFEAIFAEFRRLEAEILIPSLEKNVPMSAEHYCKFYKLHEALLFPLNFPAAVLDLHYHDIVPVKNWVHILNIESIYSSISLKIWYDKIQYSHLLINAICWHIWSLDKCIQGTAMKGPISDWVKERIGQFSVLQLIKGITMFKHGIEKGILYLDNWTEKSSLIHKYLLTYVPGDDKECPLGPKEIWRHKLVELDRDKSRSTQNKINDLRKALATLKAKGLPEDHDVIIENNMLITYYSNQLEIENKRSSSP